LDASPGSSVRLSLDEGRGRPGSVVDLHLSVLTFEALKSLSIAINFDEGDLRLLGVFRVSEDDPLGQIDVRAANVDNRDEVPGDQVREGWVYLELANTDGSSDLDVPNGRSTPILRLSFAVRRAAQRGFSPVRFEDVGPVTVVNQAVFLRNAVEVDAEPIDAAVPLAQDAFCDGGIEIIGEIGFFLRGDVDMNCRREVSDPIAALFYLFLGGPEPACLDAADADDSGSLDISDPVFCLLWMFSNGTDFSEPFARLAEDPTSDHLDCAGGFVDPTACDGIR
jgi:hypothetical protein